MAKYRCIVCGRIYDPDKVILMAAYRPEYHSRVCRITMFAPYVESEGSVREVGLILQLYRNFVWVTTRDRRRRWQPLPSRAGIPHPGKNACTRHSHISPFRRLWELLHSWYFTYEGEPMLCTWSLCQPDSRRHRDDSYHTDGLFNWKNRYKGAKIKLFLYKMRIAYAMIVVSIGWWSTSQCFQSGFWRYGTSMGIFSILPVWHYCF